MADDLGAPLSRRKDRIRQRAQRVLGGLGRLPIARTLIALLVLIVGGIALRVLLVDDPMGGRPVAEAPIASTRGGNDVAEAVSAPKPSASSVAASSSGVPGVTITTGPVAASAGTISGPAITTVDPATPAGPAATPAGSTTDLSPGALVPALVDQTKDGPLPKRGPNGETPFAAYARPFDAAAHPGQPMVAVVVTGLGLDTDGTMDAIGKLPGAVSLAFAPYGKTLDKTVPAARSAGHELLLALPLEPFDYPDNDPGPKTLLADQPLKANLDRLYWLMTRFGGYFGLTNYMGARFTSSAAAFAPIMGEVASRGLGWLDDGSSNRSLAKKFAGDDKVPFATADMTLDTDPAREAILAALGTLEARAKKQGTAIGMISALPVSIATVADWARTLDSEGLVLVPVSALMK